MSQATPTSRYLGPHTDKSPLDVTFVLRRRGTSTPRPGAWPQAPARREDFARYWGADPQDMETLRAFARAHGLKEMDADPKRRVLHVSGPPEALERAFGVTFGRYQLSDGRGPFVGCSHAPALPPEAIAVLGLDRRPVAQSHVRRPKSKPSATFTPLQLGQLYGFPPGTDGTGQAIALIELGGGFSSSDLTTYFAGLGIKKAPTVTAVSVAGGSSQPGGSADDEVMLDIEVSGALAPGAHIVVYFAPNTDQGFYEAISQAAHDTVNKPTVMSISWGGPESGWSSQAVAAMQTALEDAATLGLTVTVAAGDNGSGDGVSDGQPHVDFPASSPYALACGGTKLVAGGTSIKSEIVWNETSSDEGASGGGVSVLFALPSWQKGSKVPSAPNGHSGRGVPDVAGDADPLTGYEVRVDGEATVIGGTSAVAPLWAALIARCNQSLGSSLGDVHALLYQIGAPGFHDITQGNNGAYQAGPGWDPCTGLGSPNGQALLAALTAQKARAG